jgi:hypothetical protein
MVTDEQVRLLRQRRMEGKKQEAAAAAAGMSVRTAREWEEGPLPSEVNQERWWRTRGDPFVDVWATDVVALLESDPRGALQAKTFLEELQRRHPGQFSDRQVRTLQRRIRDWRALHGPAKEVFFQQEHVPGREGAFDFTDMRGGLGELRGARPWRAGGSVGAGRLSADCSLGQPERRDPRAARGRPDVDAAVPCVP